MNTKAKEYNVDTGILTRSNAEPQTAPTCAAATINGNPRLASSVFELLAVNDQKRATTNEPKLSVAK